MASDDRSTTAHVAREAASCADDTDPEVQTVSAEQRAEAAAWLGIDVVTSDAIPAGVILVLTGPLDLSDIAHLSGFKEMTHHDREQVGRFAALLKVLPTAKETPR